MLLIKTAYRKYFEAVTTPMLYFLCENISLKIEGKESVLLWLPASDSLLYIVTTETGLPHKARVSSIRIVYNPL